MNFKVSILGILGGVALATLVCACSETAAPAPNIVE